MTHPTAAHVSHLETDEVQFRATTAHLRRVQEAARNLEARVDAKPSKLARVDR